MNKPNSLREWTQQVAAAAKLAFHPDGAPPDLTLIDFNEPANTATAIAPTAQSSNGVNDLQNWRILGDKLHGGSSDYKLSYGESDREHYDPETGHRSVTRVRTLVWEGTLRRLKDVDAKNHWLDTIAQRPRGKMGKLGIVPEPGVKKPQPTSQTPHAPTNDDGSTVDSYRATDKRSSELRSGQTFEELARELNYLPSKAAEDEENQRHRTKTVFGDAGTGGKRHPSEPDEQGFVDGFAAVISPAYIWPALNLRQYDYLAFNIKTDGRPYCFNVRTRGDKNDVWIGRINAEEPGRPVRRREIALRDLWGTTNGRPHWVHTTIPKSRIESFGFSITGAEGPFRLEIECIAAGQGEMESERRYRRFARESAIREIQQMKSSDKVAADDLTDEEMYERWVEARRDMAVQDEGFHTMEREHEAQQELELARRQHSELLQPKQQQTAEPSTPSGGPTASPSSEQQPQQQPKQATPPRSAKSQQRRRASKQNMEDI